MNQSLIHPFTGAEIIKANFKGKLKTITKAMVPPGICTVEYKQLETGTQNVQYCSARPKSILPDPIQSETAGEAATMKKIMILYLNLFALF